MMARAAMLRVENVGFRIHGHWLVRNVSFTLTEGITALVGPNGAGKSTLLRLLAGLLPLHRGRALLQREDGRPLGVGYIPQFPGAYERLTPREFLVRTAWWDKRGDIASLGAKAEQVLARFDLDPIKNTPGQRLHISQRRRVALASLWMRNVGVVLLDEPTAGLDPEERLAFWQELYHLRELEEAPRSYLVTTHLLSEAELYCDALIFLDQGGVRHQGPLVQFPSLARSHAFFAPGPRFSPTVIDTGRFSPEGYWVLATHAQEGLSPREPDVVDAYLWTLHQRNPRGVRL